MTTPRKNTAWAQGLYAVSTTKKECLGAIRETEDGRRFRYALSNATLVAGGSTYSPGAEANHTAQVQTSGAVNAIGTTRVTVYVGATAVTASMYDDGYLMINRTATGAVAGGEYYPISGHTTSAAGSETIIVTLKEALVKATALTTYISLFANPWRNIGICTDNAVAYTGQAMVAATAAQYLWVQTGGFGAGIGEGTAAVGSLLIPSDTSLELELGTAYTSPIAGYVYGTAQVAGYVTPVILQLD